MRIGIIGAGFTGLSAGYQLSKAGHKVVIFEKDLYPGGLAIGYKEKNWEWSLEKHYHHWFTNDSSILNLAYEIGHKFIIKRPITSVYIDDKSYQLDSATSVLKFPKLKFIDKLRMAAVVGFLRVNPIWKPLENFKATSFLKNSMGKHAYEMLWEPQLSNKFGSYVNDISLAWFWARIRKRTSSLAYPEGGFLEFAQHLECEIEQRGGKIHYNTEVIELSSKNKPEIKFRKIGNLKLEIGNFDKVVVTLPSFLFLKISPQLPDSYTRNLIKLKGLGAINLILRLKKQFMTDNTYWLSICNKNSPVMAVVEHTNFMDKKHYDNEHIVYLGNYMAPSDPRFKMSSEQLLALYDPWLRKINPNYQLSILNSQLFKAPFAQPIIPIRYSKLLPSFKTPLKGVYLANIEQVYPWDRGTNYAVELGEKIARIIINQ